jgi:hypothetical protein
MSDPVTAADLRAPCPKCRTAVAVALRGKTWRMVAHKRRESHWNSSYDVACPVRNVDAAPLIAAWIATIEADAQRFAREAHDLRVKAAECDDLAAAKRDRHAALLAAFGGAK